MITATPKGVPAARAVVGMPEGAGSTISAAPDTPLDPWGATLKGTTFRAGRVLREGALIYQHSDDDRQQEVAAGLDATVRKARQEAAGVPDDPPGTPDDRSSGANLVRDH
ncbi:hypothetical protein [Streptomyces sp. MBT33]|uniref:hypothetical protein n=1 Tax=Streptomyces sp. MBT33 TaxID=1488363 RepID=UPI001909A53C|nr:hypothetical protein [Streptomyces sp. MBT33]MBK3646055.1 hypothetical protein [Streptomyces sp. MBT33]